MRTNYYLVLEEDKGDNIFKCGILGSSDEKVIDNPSKCYDKMLLKDEDANRYFKAFQDNKDLHYNTKTKVISLVERPLPPPIPLTQLAQDAYNKGLVYGSGYLWNKLTKDEQGILTEYLDALNDIIDGTDTKSTELPEKPTFIK